MHAIQKQTQFLPFRAMSIKIKQRTSAHRPSSTTITIGPQKGFQERVLSCSADIVVCGGGAGPGKTWALLMDAARHHQRPGWRALILRRTSPEITNPGAMWDESFKLYPLMGGTPSELTWSWGRDVSIKFGHCQHEKDRFGYDGAQAAFVGFDQVEHFTATIFWHLWSRMRSTCGVRPYLRATANPVPEDDAIGGWLHKLIAWWIDKDGFIIPERDGVIRWLYRNALDDTLIWADSKAQLIAKCPLMKGDDAISFTFIEGKLEDNVILKNEDPGYEAKLRLLPKVERERLLHRNWNARPASGNVFNRAWFKIVQVAPVDTNWIRYWDKAGTDESEDPHAAFTAGVKMGYSPSTNAYYVGNCTAGQWQAFERETVIRQCAESDGQGVTIWIEQEPGSGGKESAKNTIINTVPGFACFADRVRGNKEVRANPFAAMVQALNVYLVAGDWNEAYLNEMHNFVPNSSCRKDRVDASSGAFNKLIGGRPLEILGQKPLTDEEETALSHERNDAFIQQVKETGCVFPGD